MEYFSIYEVSIYFEWRINLISIIIPTKNRENDVKNVLHSICEQTIQNFEVIIIDQSTNNDTSNFIKKFSDKNKNLKIIYIHDQDISGASQARNVGVGLAKGDYILFLDDDVVLSFSYIENLLSFFSDVHVAGIGGIIENERIKSKSVYLKNLIFRRGIFRDKRIDFQYKPKEIMLTNFLSGGNSMYRTEVLNGYEFDETLTGYTLSEDKDLSYRISRKHKLYLTNKASLKHFPSKNNRMKKIDLTIKRFLNTKWFFHKNKVAYYEHFYYYLNNLPLILSTLKNYNLSEAIYIKKAVKNGFEKND